MRVALLSVLDGGANPRVVAAPFRRLAGARLVDRQLDIALAAGCETIVCLASGVGKEVIELQHRAEAAGARFIAIREPRNLSGLITANEEVLVMAAGVLPDEQSILRHLQKPGILTFPEDPAASLGYERIDANFVWAGALLVRGTAIEHLARLPGDVDTQSALLRIALQTGTRLHPLETRLLDEHQWLRDPSADELAACESIWVANHADVAPFTAPGLAIAERFGARLARDRIGSNLPRILALAAALTGLVSLSLGLAGWTLTGFGVAALAMVFMAMEGVIWRISTAGQVRPKEPLLVRALTILRDPLMVLLIALASPEDTEWLRLFVPVILFGLLHLGENLSNSRWRRTYADRVSLSVLLLPAVVFGVVQPIAAVLALAILITIFLTSGARK